MSHVNENIEIRFWIIPLIMQRYKHKDNKQRASGLQVFD